MVFCLTLLLLTFGSTFLISAQEIAEGGVDLVGGWPVPPTKSLTPLPFGSTTVGSDAPSLTVRLEDAKAGEINVNAEVHFNTDFGTEASGRIRLRRASEEIIVTGPLRSISLLIKCNPNPKYLYHATEQTFLLEQARLEGWLAENELVYADVVIVDQDGAEYGFSSLQTRVTK